MTDTRVFDSIESLCNVIIDEHTNIDNVYANANTLIVTKDFSEIERIVEYLSYTYDVDNFEEEMINDCDYYYININNNELTIEGYNSLMHYTCDRLFISNDMNSKVLQCIDYYQCTAYEI